ncbi:MAG: hypothetical protein ABGY09_00680, partial [Euryarchaeota archaeon]
AYRYPYGYPRIWEAPRFQIEDSSTRLSEAAVVTDPLLEFKRALGKYVAYVHGAPAEEYRNNLEDKSKDLGILIQTQKRVKYGEPLKGNDVRLAYRLATKLTMIS